MDSKKEININTHEYYFSDDMIDIKNLDENKIQIDDESHINIFTYFIGYVTVKKLSYVKIKSLNPLYLFIDKINEKIEKVNRNKYLTLAPTDESKGILT